MKALVSQINYNLFDLEVGAQQSQFAYLQAKDLADSVDGLMRTHDVALWNGNDTSLARRLLHSISVRSGRLSGRQHDDDRQYREHRGRNQGDGRADGGELVL